MAAALNERAFEHAKKLIAEGKFVLDERDLWSEHQPTTEQENRFIAEHGFGEYGKWYLVHDHATLSGIERWSSCEQPKCAQTRSAISWALSSRAGSRMARFPWTQWGSIGLSQGLLTGR